MQKNTGSKVKHYLYFAETILKLWWINFVEHGKSLSVLKLYKYLIENFKKYMWYSDYATQS